MNHLEMVDQKAKLAITPDEMTDTGFTETICENAAENSAEN